MMMMTKEMGTALREEVEIDPWKGEAVTMGVLQVHMEEAGRGIALTMVGVQVHTTNWKKGAVLIMEELEALGMKGMLL